MGQRRRERQPMQVESQPPLALQVSSPALPLADDAREGRGKGVGLFGVESSLDAPASMTDGSDLDHWDVLKARFSRHIKVRIEDDNKLAR